MHLNRHRMLAAALAAALTAIAPQASAQEMKLASATINDGQHEWQKLFVEGVKARIGDKLKMGIYPSSQLGAIPRMAEGVSLGTIEAFITPTSFVTNLDPRFQIFEVPGLFRSPQHQYAVIHDPAYRDHLETMFLDKGLRVIGAIYNSPTVILTEEAGAEAGRHQGHEGAHLRFTLADGADEVARRDPDAACAVGSDSAAPVRRPRRACWPACRS